MRLENRDNIFENKLKNDNVQIPESLHPENIEEKLARMTQAEMDRRSQSPDVPENFSSESDNTEKFDRDNKTERFDREYNTEGIFSDKPVYVNTNSDSNNVTKISTQKSVANSRNKQIRRVVFPLVLAASFIIVLGLGIKIGMNRNIKSEDAVQKNAYDNSVAETKDEAVVESEADESAETVGAIESAPEAVETEEYIETEADDSVLTEGADQDEEDTSNYDLAFDALSEIKENMEVVYQTQYDLMEEDDTMDAAAPETATEASNSAGITSKKTLDGISTHDISNGLRTYKSGTTESEQFTDTNVRTEGVNEADIVKTDGKYIYIYEKNTEHISIYKVDKGNMERTGSINVLQDSYEGNEMYIYNDRLVFMGSSYNFEDYTEHKTMVQIFDISNKENPKELKTIYQDGLYNTSRMADGILYTFSSDGVDLDKIDKRKYETYVPEIDGLVIDNKHICVQKNIYNDKYTVISSIDVTEGNVIDRFGALAGGDTVYVGPDSIYLADRQYDWTSFGYKDSTKLLRISYDKGNLSKAGDGDFPGYLNDDYSIDEYNKHVRLVTTYSENYTTYNALYIMDMDLKKVSVIKKLAENETIKSARFMGDTAYFVTFRQTDPLFAVDLSNPDDPRILDYLKIPGFSAYMHPYSDNLLLGIGYDADENGRTTGLKLSMFDISDPGDVKEVDKLSLSSYEMASVLMDRNAFMFNTVDGTFGFAASSYYSYYVGDREDTMSKGPSYLIFDYDENSGFKSLMEQEIWNYSDVGTDIYISADSGIEDTRGIVIGDYLYVVKPGTGIMSFDTTNYEHISTVD